MHMLRDQKGFHFLPLLLILVVAGVVGFVGFTVINKHTNKQYGGSSEPAPSEQGPNYKALSECGSDPMLTVAPMDLSKLDSISPLGGIAPPEHTQPTDHMYFMFKYERPASERYDVVAPGNIVVTSIGYGGEVENGKYKNTDYAIDFSPCKGLSFRLSHINTLEGVLKGEVGLDGKGAGCNESSPVAGKVKLNCGKNVDISIKAGELIGKVGATYVAALDVWAHKTGYKNPKMITPEYSYSFDSVCPVDYYTPAIQAKMYALVKRTAEPRCGEIGQDKKDTLQGGWYSHKDPEEARTDWNSHLTLAHNSGNPGVGVLAVAGKIAQPYVYNFTPKHAGTINREPSETKAGTVYCYQHEGNRRFSNGTMAGEGKTLFKLIDNHTTQVEYKTGLCSADEALSKPTTYYR